RRQLWPVPRAVARPDGSGARGLHGGGEALERGGLRRHARSQDQLLGQRASALRALRPPADADDLGRRVRGRSPQSRRLATARLGLVPVGVVLLPVQLHRPAGRHGAGRVHAGRATGRAADRRPPLRRSHRAPGCARLRDRAPVGGPQAAGRVGVTVMADAVGFIGLGTMGGPMAANLAKAGVRLVVYDVSAAAATAAARQPGVTVAASPSDVASRVAVLFTCLPNDDIVRTVYLGANGIAAGARAGLVTCDCSTVSPEATLDVAAGVKSRGIVHMDTPMLGSQPQAVSGEIFFIVGGERDKLPVIKPYLDVMGRLHMYVGPSATGNRVKLLHN